MYYVYRMHNVILKHAPELHGTHKSTDQLHN